jgi:hypothetical protein
VPQSDGFICDSGCNNKCPCGDTQKNFLSVGDVGFGWVLEGFLVDKPPKFPTRNRPENKRIEKRSMEESVK